jgi:hypothetical protein
MLTTVSKRVHKEIICYQIIYQGLAQYQKILNLKPPSYKTGGKEFFLTTFFLEL